MSATRARATTLAATSLALLCLASIDAEARDYRRTDPDLPGGERHGDDDGDDGFTGYPVDPGSPGDAYRDASTEYRAYSPNWTGAFIGFGVLGGMTASGGDFVDQRGRGPAGGAFLNWASLNQIIDVQFQYLYGRSRPEFDGRSDGLTRQSVGGTLLLHPLLLAIINEPRLGYTAASVYFLAGVGAELIAAEHAAGVRRHTHLGWRIGAGLDTYLDDPNDGGAFWLGIQFQRAYIAGPIEVGGVSRGDLRDNWLFVRLSYRYNGGLFSGFSGPRRR